MKRPCRSLHRLLLVAAFSTVLGPAHAGSPVLEVFPTHPTCFYETTLKVRGYFPDQCFQVDEISLWESHPWLVFRIFATDSWTPSSTCALGIVTYSAVEAVGPLPAGSYTLVRDEIVQSLRYQGNDVGLPFQVACCEPLPAPVTDLRIAKAEVSWKLELRWSDVEDADSYSIYLDTEPDGLFANLADIVSSGEDGAEVFVSSSDAQFFLVSGNNSCGSGPPRQQGQ